MGSDLPVRVFIGSGEASLLERKVLIYSLRKHTSRKLDIYTFNGTHNSIEINDSVPVLAPLPLHLKYRNITEFTLYRFIIPEICQYQGHAIYLDSDIICLKDIGKLFDLPLEGKNFLARPNAYDKVDSHLWALSVMLIDCSRCNFDLETYYQEIDKQLYSYTDFSCMSEKFRQYHPFKIGELDEKWNTFDYWDNSTNLIHYTDLGMQPWKYPNHPYGELWFSYFQEARDAGYITDRDIELSFARTYVRTNLLEGNSPGLKNRNSLAKKAKTRLKKALQNLK